MVFRERIRKIFVAMHANASTIIAVSSMLIAGMSLYFTINAQRLDLEYKEVSIQPRVSLNGVGESLSMVLRNVGLGPAVITDVVLKVAGKCVRARTSSDAEWIKAFQDFTQAIIPDVFTKALSPAAWKSKKGFDVESDTIYIEDTIRPGDDRWLVRLDPGSMKEVAQIDRSEFAATKIKFAKSVYDAPIKIRYCSATGRTCGEVGEAGGCD